jgi:hypothetical protein
MRTGSALTGATENGSAVSTAAEAATAKTMVLMLFPSFFLLKLAFLQLQSTGMVPANEVSHISSK